MNLDIEIPNRNFHELCNVIKWKEAPHTYNKEELQAKSIADALYNNMTLDPDDVLKRSHSCAHGKEETFNYLLLGKSDEELQNDVSQIYHCHSCYIFLPGEYYILSNRLLREGNYLQWLTLLQNLKHLFLQTAARPPEQDQRCAGRDGGALHNGGRQCPDRRDGSAAASGRCVPR